MSFAEQLGTFSITVRKKFFSLALTILTGSLLSGICSFFLYGYFFTSAGGGEGPPLATPWKNPFATAAFFISIAFVGAFLIFLIFKYNKIIILKIIFAFSILVTTFFFVFLFIYTIPYYILEEYTIYTYFQPRTEIIILVLALLAGLVFSIFTVISMVFKLTPQPFPQITAMLFAVLSGTFLATFLPTLGAVLVMIGLSIYDIISVFKGPIKKMAEISEERRLSNNTAPPLKNSTIEEGVAPVEPIVSEETAEEVNVTTNSIQEPTATTARSVEQEEYYYAEFVELGLGDLAFFGMLFSFALIKLGVFSAIAAFIGVIIGAIFTIKLLDRVKLMPGLPLSIGLGLLLAFGVWGILALSGYTGWGWINPNWYG